ncbi:MAG: hypothetical protein KDA78_13265 [Planctomycetaceae bacterium]|nr:hypothetical protein [Planctomycetaceae bacterium]
MKQLLAMAGAVALALGTSLVIAEEAKSGLQPGQNVGAFFVTKVCGAEGDGVEVGKNLCYRCKNGRRPQVMVFTRSADAKVVELIKQLDHAIPENEASSLRAFVNYMGEDQASAKTSVEKLASAAQAKYVPFVVPNEFENGPDDYGINPNAEVTIIMAKGGVVQANFAATSAKDLDVKAVVEGLQKILN